jgi:tetratricopeptide (TPR) repeat protein
MRLLHSTGQLLKNIQVRGLGMHGRVSTLNITDLRVLIISLLLLQVWLGTSPVLAESSETVTLAAARIDAGDLKTAEQELRKAVAKGSRDPEVYHLLGFICDRTGRADEATSHFREALQLAPGSSRAHNDLGAHYFRRGRRISPRNNLNRPFTLIPTI